jgi:hypothetical protein
MSMSVSEGAFDYSKLAARDADALRARARDLRERISALHAEIADAERRVNRSAASIGGELLDLKDRLPHGAFGRWCQAELGLEARTAQNFMNAARLLRGLPPEKSETVSHLPAATLYALAAPSVPEDVRAALVDRVAAGEPLRLDVVRREVEAARKAGQEKIEAEKKRAADERMTPRQRNSRRAREAKRAREQARWEEEQKQRRRATEELARLLVAGLPAPEHVRVLELLDAARGWNLDEAIRHALRERRGDGPA